MRQRQQIYYAALTQFENVGDALINRELLRALSERANVRCYVGGCPSEYTSQLEQPDSAKADRPLSAMLLDLAVAGLKSRGRPVPERPVLLATPGDVNGAIRLNNVLKAVTYVALGALGVRIWRLGVSFTHLSATRAAVEGFALRFMERVAVRDSSSGKFVRSAGVEPHTLPDLSFLLPFVDRTPAPQRTKVAISFRDQDLSEADTGRLAAKVIEFCGFIAGVGLTPVLTVQVARDLAFAKRIQAEASTHLDIKVLKTIREAEAFYDECTLAFGNRLHVLLLAASRGCVPVAALREGTSQKIRMLFSDVGFGDRIVDWTSDWCATAASSLQNRSEILTRVARVFATKSQEIKEYFDCTFATETCLA